MFNDTHTHPLRSFLHAVGRHRGHPGFGHGPGFGGRFRDGDGSGFSGGRKLGSSELQLVILALLADGPAHGYEIIRMLEERSGGFYTPSPGMIYPALTYLAEIGHAVATREGARKSYAITEEGRAHLAAHRVAADAIMEALKRIGGRMEQVREAFAGVGDLDPQAADEMHRARHALKHALMRRRGCGPEEARRIVTILDAATAAILKGQG